MNINFERNNSSIKNPNIVLDTNKKNILILGKALTNNKQNEIIQPKDLSEAKYFYGNSELYLAFEEAYNLTNQNNIYTVNCFTMSDYIKIIDIIIHYDFHYIVPIGIYLSDTFYDPIKNTNRHYINFYTEELYNTNSLSTVIFTERHGSLYKDIDDYMFSMKDIVYEYNNNTNKTSIKNNTLNDMNSNMLFTLNMLNNVSYSNIVLACQMSLIYSDYPKNISYIPTYDLELQDIDGCNFIYYKYNHLNNYTDVENLINFRVNKDIYKNALINDVIKSTIRKLDLDMFRGRLYNSYTKLQIENKVKLIMNNLKGNLFKDFSISNIGYVKTSASAGYIYVELSIIPYGSFENVKIVMGV